MPFKIKLKKSRQYNVVSKSLFVTSIELLDGVVVECTLGAESAASECLENVCQRLSIGQPELFGLRLVGRSGPRWLQLERPLKRQLERERERCGGAAPPLQLRVQHYLPAGSDPAPLRDEMTRYHYFLQTKADLHEGRTVCDLRQAVVLASYGRQAEYGNFDAERHTVDYLKKCLSFDFPKLMRDGGQIIDRARLSESQLECLTTAVMRHHRSLYNLPQAQAEEGYISTCQSLEGYGQETFIARDHLRQNDVEISISVTGICVSAKNSETSKIYPWTEIKNVINHKRNFTIECQNSTESSSVVFNSAEDGKYVWRMCVLQHTFFTKYRQLIDLNNQVVSTEYISQPNFQNDGLGESRDDLDCIALSKDNSSSVPTLLENNELKNISYGGSQQELQLELLQPLSVSQRALSTSCLDLAASSSHIQSQNDLEKLRALLPFYRPAPDYDTAVQQKYNQQIRQQHFSNQQGTSTHSNLSNSSKAFVYGSQPEIHRPIHYPDVTRHTAAINRPIRLPDELNYNISPLRHNAYTNFALNGGVIQPGIHQQIHYLNVYKPPPPYPSNGLVSNSTPDLAVASQSISPVGYHGSYINSHVSGSSPDLVSSRTFLNRHYINRMHSGNTHNLVNYAGIQNLIPSVHGTYENLSSVMDTSNRHYVIETPHHLTNHIQKVFDDRGNIMYCVPATQVPYQSHIMLQQHQKLKTVSDQQEPIYENVPLPWQNEQSSLAVRDKAYSFTSPPDINRSSERKTSQPVLTMLNNNQNAQISINSPNFPATYNKNVGVMYVSDNHYANAQALKSSSESKDILNEKNVSHDKLPIKKTDVCEITDSINNLSLSKDICNEYGSNMSLKGSVSSNINLDSNEVIQTSDNNNVTTITISASNNHVFGWRKSNNSMHRSNTSDVLYNLKQREILGQSSVFDSSLPTSSFLDSTQGASTDFESSVVSTSTTGSISTKDKKKRWWLGLGKSSKTDVKSATLGRDKGKKNQSNQQSTERHRWSTALHKMQPLPPSISKEAMCQLLERKMTDSQLLFTFERIPKGRDSNSDMTTALHPDNSHINAGNIDFLPYEDNRVRLTPTKMNKHGYINASHITATVGSNQRFYIACSIASQGNNVSLISNIFWQAVWEVGARVVALISSNTTPDHLPELLPGRMRDYGQYQVIVESSQSTEYVITTRLRLVNGNFNYGVTGLMGHIRTVWHLQYTEWPDNITIPKSTSHFLGFLEELSAVRQHCATEMTPLHNANPPLFVACFQGTGRSGVTIASDLLLYTFEHNQELDIQRVIGLLHQQRSNLVQNVHQYRFIHGLLIHYLKQTRLI